MSSSITSQIREAARTCGLSQQELARRSGVPQPRICQFLAGGGARGETLDRLARTLGLKIRKEK